MNNKKIIVELGYRRVKKGQIQDPRFIVTRELGRHMNLGSTNGPRRILQAPHTM